MKVAFDCTAVGISVLISLLATGEIIGAREGTVLAMLLVGKVIGLFERRFGAGITGFCFGKEESGVSEANELPVEKL